MNPAHWSWPQWIWLSLLMIKAGSAAVMDGKPHKDPFYRFKPAIVMSGISLFLLWAGGFFR